jgi:hypothetical protein
MNALTLHSLNLDSAIANSTIDYGFDISQAQRDKHSRMARLETAQEPTLIDAAIDKIKSGLTWLNENKSTVIKTALVVGAVLAGYYLINNLPSFSFGLFKQNPLSDIGLSSAAESLNSASEHSGKIVEVLLNGDAKFEDPIQVNGVRYSLEAFKDALPDLVPNPELGDGLKIIPGEKCRVSTEIGLQNLLENTKTPYMSTGEFRSQLEPIFDPFNQFEKSIYFNGKNN